MVAAWCRAEDDERKCEMATSKELLNSTLGSTPKTLDEARAGLADLRADQASVQRYLEEALTVGDVDALMRLRAEADALPMKITAATAVVTKFELEVLEERAKVLDAAMVEAAAAVEEALPIYTAAKAEYDHRVSELHDARDDRRGANLSITEKRTNLMRLIGAIRDGKPLVIEQHPGAIPMTPEQIAGMEAKRGKIAGRTPPDPAALEEAAALKERRAKKDAILAGTWVEPDAVADAPPAVVPTNMDMMVDAELVSSVATQVRELTAKGGVV